MAPLWIAVACCALAVCAVAVWVWRRNDDADADVAMPAPSAAGPTPEPPAAAGADVASGAHAPVDPQLETYLLRRLLLQAFASVPPAEGEALPPAPAEIHAGISAAVGVTLARIDGDARHVPRRPHLLPQLTRAINDRNATAQSIAAILRQDPALAANLLQIVNSVAYRRSPEPIENLERAVAMLGSDGLRQLIMAALLQPVVEDDGSPLARCAAVLWEHTLLAAREAAERARGIEGADPHAVQLLALLQGLGAVVVLQVLRDAYARRIAVGPEASVAVDVLERWSLPVALRISAGWAISHRTRSVLEALQAGTAADAFAACLHHGRVQAAQQLLVADA